MAWWGTLPSWAQGLVLALAAVTAIAVASGIATTAARRRRRAFEGAGARLGMVHARRSEALRSKLQPLPLFGTPGRHLCEQVLSATVGAREDYLFEHLHLERRRQDDPTPNHYTTVFAARIPGARFPAFTIEPTGLANRAAAAIAGDRVEVGPPGPFTARFQVRGAAVAEIQRWCDGPLLDALGGIDHSRPWLVDARGEWIAVYAPLVRVAPEALEVLLAAGRTVAAAFEGRRER